MRAVAREEDIRHEVRLWLDDHWDPSMPVGKWWRALAEGGWAYPSWPSEWFGRALPPPLVRVVRDERRRVGALAPPSGVGPAILAPMLFLDGTDEQRRRLLPALAFGEVVVGQMLSEPNAGSDLAAVLTRAERDGSQWRLTGQKTWCSGAAEVDYGMVLARTDPEVPKHAGLTFFLVARDQPGVDVRPLRTMTGDTHFNDVFLDGAVVDDADRLGAVDAGWRVARTFLAFEKNALNPAAHEGGYGGKVHDLSTPAGDIARAVAASPAASAMGRGGGRMVTELWRQSGRTDERALRQRMVEIFVLRKLVDLTNLRVKAIASQGGRPGAEGAISKLLVARMTRAQRDLGLAVQGPFGMLAGTDAAFDGAFHRFAVQSPSISIAGGTDEIQKNHLAERVLGLPSEWKPDDSIPFREALQRATTSAEGRRP